MKVYPLPNRILWWLIQHIGAWAVLGCVVVGAFIILCIVFPEKIREVFGAPLKWLDKFVNKDK